MQVHEINWKKCPETQPRKDLVAILDVAKNPSSYSVTVITAVFPPPAYFHHELTDKELENSPGCFQRRDKFLVNTGNSCFCITSTVPTRVSHMYFNVMNLCSDI